VDGGTGMMIGRQKLSAEHSKVGMQVPQSEEQDGETETFPQRSAQGMSGQVQTESIQRWVGSAQLQKVPHGPGPHWRGEQVALHAHSLRIHAKPSRQPGQVRGQFEDEFRMTPHSLRSQEVSQEQTLEALQARPRDALQVPQRYSQPVIGSKTVPQVCLTGQLTLQILTVMVVTALGALEPRAFVETIR